MTVMTRFRTSGVSALALALMLGAGTTVIGPSAQAQQRMQQAPAQQGMGPGIMGQGMGPGMMGPGMGGQGMSPGMMEPGTMGQGMGPGMMSPGMGPGMMGPGMGPAMMAPGMGPRVGGWSGLEGRRVMPTMQLSTDDVRTFFERHLAALGNERLKVGNVEAMDDDTITAEVVTVDDSLVESFEVDRHTGLISPAG